jgi:hypothetical protein
MDIPEIFRGYSGDTPGLTRVLAIDVQWIREDERQFQLALISLSFLPVHTQAQKNRAILVGPECDSGHLMVG